jgi:aspartate kinase
MKHNRQLRVEKIGGTSMSRFAEIIDNVILRRPDEVYGRVYVVSAYAGITNELLEHKKTKKPGIYELFKEQGDYPRKMLALRDRLYEINRGFEPIGLHQSEADEFCRRAY